MRTAVIGLGRMGEHESWWTTELGATDAGLAVDVARRAGVDLPLAATVRGRYEEASRRGGGEDVSVVSRLSRRD